MSMSNPNLAAVLLTALLATFVLTPILSLLVLRRYRRAVRRSMHATAPGSKQPAKQAMRSEVRGPLQPRSGGASAPVIPVPPENLAEASAGERPEELLIRQRTRSLCLVYVAAGIAYGLLAASVSMQAQDIEFVPRRFAVLAARSMRRTRAIGLRRSRRYRRRGGWLAHRRCRGDRSRATGGRAHHTRARPTHRR